MTRLALVAFLCLCTLAVGAQEQQADSIKNWKAGGTSSLNFSQVSLTNWAGGGNNSLAGTLLFKGFLNHKKNKFAWDNALDFSYGLTKQGDYKVAKSEDKLYMSSKLGYEAGKHWYYSALLDFKTQFAEGYKDPLVQEQMISEFLAPGYVQFSFGMDYKPSDNFSLYLSPITSKLTIVNNDSLANIGAFGVEPGENLRQEYGASVKLLAKKKDIIKNVNAYTRLDLFSSYTDNPENIDVDWEFGFEMKVNKYLSAVFTMNMVYDDDISYVDEDGNSKGPQVQIKQLFGAGLTYSF
ncbi:DUF3078 domain-containing protein [Labilibacter marinus]|uniref:DUF3078 domain-containing protein n=1 Tax=Labilibacter marinus TaxID=1477105 RepID=UPI00082F17A5|nr:DUF3078 domain-containing protein [Labilibacter marinus]